MSCYRLNLPNKPMKTNDKQPDGVSKVSVSLPPDLLDWIDAEAKKDRRARSTWIAIQLETVLASKRGAQQSQPDEAEGNKRKSG